MLVQGLLLLFVHVSRVKSFRSFTKNCALRVPLERHPNIEHPTNHGLTLPIVSIVVPFFGEPKSIL